MVRPAQSHFAAIDLLRFVCALMVMAFHYAAAFPMMAKAPFHLLASDQVLPDTYKFLAAYGWVGVEIFFVISGYVIAVSSENADAGAFIRRRVLRLMPAAWLCATTTALTILLIGRGDGMLGFRWMAALAFVPLKQPIDPSYWTLGAETGFYALVAATLVRSPRSTRAADRIALLLGVAGITYWIITLAVGREGPIMAALPSLFRYGHFFALGVVMWRIRAAGPNILRVAGAILLTVFGLLEMEEWTLRTAAPLGITPHPLWPALAFLTGLGVILAADRLQAPLTRAIGRARLEMLGLMTYPLYLLHQVLGAIVIAELLRVGLNGYTAMIMTAILMIAIAWLITRHAEPGLRLWMAARIDAFSRRGSQQDRPPTASLPTG